MHHKKFVFKDNVDELFLKLFNSLVKADKEFIATNSQILADQLAKTDNDVELVNVTASKLNNAIKEFTSKATCLNAKEKIAILESLESLRKRFINEMIHEMADEKFNLQQFYALVSGLASKTK